MSTINPSETTGYYAGVTDLRLNEYGAELALLMAETICERGEGQYEDSFRHRMHHYATDRLNKWARQWVPKDSHVSFNHNGNLIVEIPDGFLLDGKTTTGIETMIYIIWEATKSERNRRRTGRGTRIPPVYSAFVLTSIEEANRYVTSETGEPEFKGFDVSLNRNSNASEGDVLGSFGTQLNPDGYETGLPPAETTVQIKSFDDAWELFNASRIVK